MYLYADSAQKTPTGSHDDFHTRASTLCFYFVKSQDDFHNSASTLCFHYVGFCFVLFDSVGNGMGHGVAE